MMKRVLTSVTWITLWGMPLAAHAVQEPPPPAEIGGAAEPRPAQPAERHLTLDQAIQEALAAAPGLQAAQAQEQAGRLRATAISRSRFGQADVVGIYTHYQDDQLVRPMALQLFGPAGMAGLPWDRDQAHYGVTYQVPLYLGGRLTASIAVSSLQADQAALVVAGTRWDIRANVTALYAAHQAVERVLAAAGENLMALEATERRVTALVQQGRRPNLDLLKIQDDVQAARAQVSSVGADLTRVDALLLAAMGLVPGSAPLLLDAWPDREPTLTVDDTAVLRLAADSSPVGRATLVAREAEEARRVAQGQRYPSVAVRGTVMGHTGLGLVEHFGTWEVALQASVPILDGGSRAAAVAAAGAAQCAATAVAIRLRLEREAQAVAALARFRASHDAVAAARARVASAAEAVRIEQIRYDQGVGTMEDLLRARARDLAARSTLAQALGGRITAASQINALCEQEVVR